MLNHKPIVTIFRIVIPFFLVFLVNRAPLNAQGIPIPEGGKQPVVEILLELERVNGCRIFFNANWFEGDFTEPSIANLPLTEALVAVLQGRNLDFFYLDEYIVIFPKENRPLTNDLQNDSRVTVGNMNEYGKYTRANVWGKVVDGKTSEPLAGAIIYVEDLGVGAGTNLSGEFTIDLPVGEHKIRLSYMGYEVSYQQINVISPGELSLDLFEESHSIEGVTVYAKKADSNISQTQMSIIRLDTKALNQLPTSMGEKDIIKSITLLPGIQSAGEFGTGFNVRGGSADQNLILVEGVPLFNSSHLFGLTSIINPDLVKDVTLIKAGIPAKYGERSASVMDIRLGGKAQENINVSGGIGLLNSRLSLDMPFNESKGYVIVGGRSSYSNWLLNQIPDKDLMNSSAGFYDISGQVYSPIGQKYNISLFGYYSHDQFSYSQEQEYMYSSVMGSARFNTIHNRKTTSSFLLGYSGYKYQLTTNNLFNPLNSYGLKAAIGYSTAKWNISYYVTPNFNLESGVSAVLYQIDPGAIGPSGELSTVNQQSMEKENAYEMAGYINNSFSITPEFSLEIGLRFTQFLRMGPGVSYLYDPSGPRVPLGIVDTLTYSKNQVMASHNGFEPRANLRYQLNTSTSIKASYNRINQYINLVSNTSVATPTDVWYLSNRHINPLNSDQFALGLFKNFMNNSIETSVELYYKIQNNVLETKNNAQIIMNPLLEADLTNAMGNSYGIELFVKRESGLVGGWLSYTYSKSVRKTLSTFREEQINGNSFFPANFDKPHNLVVNANFQFSRRWRAGTTFSYSTGRPVTLPELQFTHNGEYLIYLSDRNSYRLPDYHRLDVSLSFDGSLRLKKKWKSQWTLSVVNVYGRKNIYSTFYQKEQPTATNNYRQYSLYKMYIIGRPLPTITYNFIF